LPARPIDDEDDTTVTRREEERSMCCRRRPSALAETLEDRRLLSGSISGAVYVDASGDGKRNHGEPFVPQIQVYLDLNNNEALDANEPVSITNRKGKYAFRKLSKDIYHVREMIPTGFTAITPPGGAWYVDLRFKGSAPARNFGYWPNSQGPAPIPDKGPPVNQNQPLPAAVYNTGATQQNNPDGSNSKPILFGGAGEGADPYWVVEPPVAAGADPAPFNPTYYSYDPSRLNYDLNPATPQADSAFIGPTRTGTDVLPAGQYVFATAFDLTGMECKTAHLVGVFMADPNIADVRLNGASLGLSSRPGSLLPLNLTSGFVPGINTLEIVVTTAAPGPVGLRADGMFVQANRIAPGPITLFNTGVSTPNNLDGSNTNRVAAGGVDGHWQIAAPGKGFPFYADDAGHHYIYNNSLTSARFGNAFVADTAGTEWDTSDLNPATAGVDSSWINPVGKGSTPLPSGTYIYRTWFDLTGLDPATASISGVVEGVAGIVDIYANGNASGQAVGAGGLKGQQKSFTITQGLVAGLNVLDFIVNADDGKHFSGLRVEGLHGGATGVSSRLNIGYPLKLPLPSFPPLVAPVDPSPLADTSGQTPTG
jgi:hypothetical protein